MLLKKFLGSKADAKNASYQTNEQTGKRRALADISNKYDDKDDRHVSMVTTSCTSGLTSQLQQKFSRRKSRKRADERVEVTEEYDIQSVISGLTRNSEFVDKEVPLPYVSPDRENAPPVRENVSLPVRENVSSPVRENVSLPVRENVSLPIRENVSVNPYISPQVNENILDSSAQWPDDETCGNHVIRTTTEGITKSEDVVRYRPTSHRPLRIPAPEPTGIRLGSPLKKDLSTIQRSSSKSNIYEVHSGTPGYEIVLTSEPDGVRFGRVKSKVPAEPSGKRAETIRSAKKPRGRTNRIVPDHLQNVEVVYGEEEDNLFDDTERKLSYAPRQRSKSASDARRTGDAKRRSRSLPRTLKRLTSKYLKGEGLAKYIESSSLNAQDSKSEDHFIDNVIGVVEDDILSSLGSQLEGIESQPLKRNEVEKVPIKSSHRSIPRSSSETHCEKYEPRICVEFSRRQSGGYFQTTSYPDSLISGSFRHNDENVRNGSFFPKESRTEVNLVEKSPAARPKRRNMGKQGIRAVTNEASRKLLLSPSGRDDSEDDDIFQNVTTLGAPRSDSRVGTKQGRQDAIPVTPSPRTESRRAELDSARSVPLKPPANIGPETNPLSITPAGRKDLIQQYLTLREKKIREEELNQSATSSNRVQGRCSIVRNKSGSSVSSGSSRMSLSKPYELTTSQPAAFGKRTIKTGYDDASKYYQHVDSKESLKPTVMAKRSQDLDVKIESSCTRIELQNARTRSSLSVKSAPIMKKSGSERFGTSGTKLFNNRGEDVGEKEIRSRLSRLAKDLQQMNPSYSYCTDDDSTEASLLYESTYQPDLNQVYTAQKPLKYEDELVHHNQFMKMTMGLGSM
eukprot:CAMPEP_0172379958 /NCGR_PEP_ID=MMETSP1060-20121228/70193_1 /TAXON_ID=37318 /ORGANISM="Pseudo-nitzschia pungens, Strain cf. cingulata" /LENGTH=849 /DNA_ID=CAMNT_0013107703 /DNA_START=318 /DNA_END=2867 /DNA_ORIENTATION=-